MITYDASAVRDWLQPVHYSPYPRNLDTQLEQFGHEKDGSLQTRERFTSMRGARFRRVIILK